jgi:hypothetical protein
LAAAHRCGIGIHHQISHDQRRLHPTQSPQQRIHPGNEFGEHKRFHHVVIGAGRQPP